MSEIITFQNQKMTKEQLEENCYQESLTIFVERSFYPCNAFVEILSDAACSGNKECGFPSAKVGDIATVCALLTGYAENRLKAVAQLIERSQAEEIKVYVRKGYACEFVPQALEIG